MGATKHIVQNRDDFVNFHCYPVGSQIVVLSKRRWWRCPWIQGISFETPWRDYVSSSQFAHALRVRCFLLSFVYGISFFSLIFIQMSQISYTMAICLVMPHWKVF